ncbi:MAG: DNA-binding protein [Candidatus Azobacteroides sp.]|nr:DNA-binding protein [Candidatus Azobacteroides sp.]
MKAKYDVYEMPTAGKEKEKKQYYARLVPSGTLDIKQLAEKLQYGRSITLVEIQGVLAGLVHELEIALQQGERIHLDGLGYFQMKISSEPVEDPEKMRAEYVRFKSIAFLPEKSLKKKLAGTKFIRSQRKNHSQTYSGEAMEEKLTAYFREHPFITRAEFQKLCGYTKSMALVKLNAMIKEGKLKKEGLYRFPVYAPIKGKK